MDERDMQHAVGTLDVGDVAALARDEAAILAHAALAGDETEFGRRGHRAPPVTSGPAFLPARRRAASSIASMIWP